MEEEIDDKGEIGFQKFLISTEPLYILKNLRRALNVKRYSR